MPCVFCAQAWSNVWEPLYATGGTTTQAYPAGPANSHMRPSAPSGHMPQAAVQPSGNMPHAAIQPSGNMSRAAV